MESNEIRALCSQVAGMRREIVELRAQNERNQHATTHTLGVMSRNLARLMAQPARPIGRRTDEATGQQQAAQAGGLPATLSPLPRTIYVLWQEYEFGIGGRKPAKEFTAQERGRVKYSYHRRKVVWDCVASLVRAGWQANVACDKIYEAYGRNESVTRIINKMRRDRVNGGHPQLRVANI